MPYGAPLGGQRRFPCRLCSAAGARAAAPPTPCTSSQWFWVGGPLHKQPRHSRQRCISRHPLVMPPPPPPALECPPSSRQALPASLQLHGHALRPCGCPYLGHLHKLALHRVLQGHEPRAVRRQQAAGGGFPSVGPAGFPEAPPASLIALQHPEVRKEVPLSRPGKRDKAASGPAANGCRRSGETRGGAREPVPDGRNAKGKLPQSPATSPATRGLVAACGSHPWLVNTPRESLGVTAGGSVHHWSPSAQAPLLLRVIAGHPESAAKGERPV